MSQLNLLLVDDEQDLLNIMLKRMKRRGFNAHGCSRGAEALRWLDENPADVVVLDMKMPGLDGIETLRRIKKAHPLVEVIILTGHADMRAAIEGMELGAFDYLLKPALLEELYYKIVDAGKRRRFRQNETSAAPSGA